jgi:N-acetylglucosaminyldiphosphoundecaprenol N-acetyl-beta-D-mannosaminyltransferase
MKRVHLPVPIRLLGVNTHPVTWDQLLDYVGTQIVKAEKCEIAYANVHCMNLTRKDHEFRDFLNRAHVVYCDGFGVLMGARILGHHIPQRMTGADWIYDLISFCEKESYSLYFLGGDEGVAEKAASKLKELFPRARIAGSHHGFFDKENSQDVVEEINRVHPDILLIGMGSPIQEKWLARHRESLDAPVCWVIGAAFDFVSGKVRRGPKWMTKNGMEWIFRLFIEPGRLWRRYILGNPVFMVHVVMQRLLGARHGRL